MKRTILAIAASVMITPAVATTGGGVQGGPPVLIATGGVIIKPDTHLIATTGGGNQGGDPASNMVASTGSKGLALASQTVAA